MALITAAQRQKLLENGRAQRDTIDRQDQGLDLQPVVKLLACNFPSAPGRNYATRIGRGAARRCANTRPSLT